MSISEQIEAFNETIAEECEAIREAGAELFEQECEDREERALLGR